LHRLEERYRIGIAGRDELVDRPDFRVAVVGREFAGDFRIERVDGRRDRQPQHQ